MRLRPRRDCPKCHGTGYVLALGKENAYVQCDCVSGEQSDDLYARSNIPEGYREGMTFHEWRADSTSWVNLAWAKADDWWMSYPQPEKTGLLFEGPSGVGKTHLAVAIANELMCEKGVEVRFFDFPMFMNNLRGTFSKEADITTQAIIAPMLKTEVVIIDNLIGPKLTAWEASTLLMIVSHRFSHRLPMIITTSHMDDGDTLMSLGVLDKAESDHRALYKEINRSSDKTLDMLLGTRLRSILFDATEVCLMWGPNYRLRRHKR